MSEGPERERTSDGPGRELLRAAPGLGRIAVATGWRLAGAAASAYGRAALRVARAATGEEASPALRPSRPSRERAVDSSTAALRRRGEELLRESADIRADQDSHPAYMRILDALAPDEGRILRFLAQQGSQPSVDVRTGLPLASELVAQGRTMLAEEAGCRYPDRVYAYLNNLHRLGLVWFLREPLRDASRYQLLEAQPEVTEALEQSGRTARTVRRSIVLTPFGEDFCATCLPAA